MGFWDWLFGREDRDDRRRRERERDRERRRRRQERERPRAVPPRPAAPPQPPPLPPREATPPPLPRKPTTLPLDPGRFQALDHDAVRRSASSTPWGGAFDRPSRIPPADDPRTELLDRAMVGRGLITPEALAEIHAIGEEMDRLWPDLAEAHRAADAVVAEDRAAREARKRQKKAEAAERKRRHAEAVAHRRATDIVFLGRGVSAGLADRRANVERLEAAGLPVLATPADVATALGISIPHLRWLAFHNVAAKTVHYVRFDIPKRSGGTRTLAAPHKALASAQAWILHHILAKVPVHEAAHGFVPGRSTVTNARSHVGAHVVINSDLEAFFPTVTFPRVKGLFRALGYSPAAATVLGLLVTEPPRRPVTYAGQVYHVATGPRALPQGACTSPALSNLVTRRLDARLQGIATKLGFAYSRYADDMTLSCTEAEGGARVGYLLARLRHIAQDEGFRVNERKTRVQWRHGRQEVTGIVVNDTPGVPRPVVRRLRAILHRARHEGLEAQNREGIPHFEAWLRGMIAYVAMVNPARAEPLQRALAQLP